MKRVFAFIFASLIFSCLAFGIRGQSLPVNFTYLRETGQVTGVPMFTLNLNFDAVAFDARRASPFEALCLHVQPERDKYGILFYNAKSSYQLSSSKNRSVSISFDGKLIKLKNFTPGPKNKVGSLKVETAIIVIDKILFDKLVRSTDILITVGKVKYSLDEDNIDAIRYFASEIEKDLKRRAK